MNRHLKEAKRRRRVRRLRQAHIVRRIKALYRGFILSYWELWTDPNAQIRNKWEI